MPNKKIIAFDVNINPSLDDVFPIVNNGITKKISLSGLTDFIGPYIDTTNPSLTGGTYDNNTGIATFTNTNDVSFEVSGFTTNIKHWEENNTKILKSDETLVIAGDYVLVDTNLELQKDTEITIGSLTFNKYAQIYIGGNLLVKDSNIINDGLINVAGAVILNGNSIITGTGIII
jgi:hypothetical protein